MLDTFKRLTGDLPYRPKAIFPSEMFLFYREAIGCGADHIIESGVGYGGSTTYLARLFSGVAITCVDNDNYGQFDAVKRLNPNIEFEKGDARKLLPQIVRRSKGKRLVVLIDGPKRKVALDLTMTLLTEPKVRFVAVHDLTPALAKGGALSSRDEAFREKFGELDAGVGDYLKFYPQGPGLTVFKCSMS